MKKKILTTIFIALFFLAGLSLLLYPLVSNEWNSYRQSKLMAGYDEALIQQEEEGTIDYTELWEKAKAYNEALLPSVLPDSFAVAQAEGEDSEAYRTYMDCLNPLGDGMMGTVEIPKINVKLPVFHTTEETVLEQAATFRGVRSRGEERARMRLSRHIGDFQARRSLPIWTGWRRETIFSCIFSMIRSATRWIRSLW